MKKVLKFEIDLEFVLIAIVTTLKDYRACYFINKNLHFNFRKTDDYKVDIYAESSEQAAFSMYQDHWASTETDFYFIANRGDEGLLIPEMPATDYFLMIKNFIDDEDLSRLISSLRDIPEIITAVKIDPKKIKSRENLLF